MFTPHRETDRTTQTQTRPDQQPHRPTCQRGGLSFIHFKLLLRRRYRVVLLAAAVGQSPEHFYIGSALCVSSFDVLCVTDLQVFIIVSHPESKCVSQKTSALTPRRLNKTRL